METKKALRAALSGRVPSARSESDGAMFARFLALREVAKAQTILLYRGVGAEPETARLIAPLLGMGKRVALPRCLPGGGMEAVEYRGEGHLRPHPKYGIPEPDEDCPVLSKDEIDLILVPGLAFDAAGNRLGHGGGYYDRYLAGFDGVTVALCRREFLQESIPTEQHDRPVKLVLTEGTTERAP